MLRIKSSIFLRLFLAVALVTLMPPLLGCRQCQESALTDENPKVKAKSKSKICGRMILARSADAVAQPCDTTYDLMKRLRLSQTQIKFVHENSSI